MCVCNWFRRNDTPRQGQRRNQTSSKWNELASIKKRTYITESTQFLFTSCLNNWSVVMYSFLLLFTTKFEEWDVIFMLLFILCERQFDSPETHLLSERCFFLLSLDASSAALRLWLHFSAVPEEGKANWTRYVVDPK